MSAIEIPLRPPDPVAFAPFGHLVLPPDEAGKRRFYSETLQTRPDGSAPMLHTNHVLPSSLPIKVIGIERHPHAAQCFFPANVSRYAVLVFPSDDEGDPILGSGLAFLMPGTIGVIFNQGVWHLGATVLDRPGHFTVLMWRGGPQQDDDFRTIPPLTLVAPDASAPG